MTLTAVLRVQSPRVSARKLAAPTTLIALALLASGILAARVIAKPIDLTNPPSGRFIDDWAEIYMAGGKVGYAHSSMARNGDLIETNTTMMMQIGRAGQFIKVEMTQATTETIHGAPVTFSSDMDMSVMKTSMRGRVAEGKVTITSSQLGMEQTQKFTYPKGALMTWGLYRESLKRGFKPGLTYTLKTYAPELRLDDAVEAVTTIGDWETLSRCGRVKKGQRVTTSLVSPLGSLESISWVDKTGHPIKQQLVAPGFGNMEIIVADQASAVADFIPPEIFMSTVVKAGRRLDPKRIRRAVYRLSPQAKDGDLGGLPDTGMQKATKRDDGSIDLVVTRQDPPARSAAKVVRANASAAMAEYLKSNLLINTSDLELVKVAKRAAGGETAPYKLATKLRRFVSEFVHDKSLNVGFASASEVCRTREGDCSEHGVLLAALGRIQGLPSRVVVGLAYVESFGGQRDVFGYHMWTQFHLDGRWVDFDAALGGDLCSPTRIAFATSSLKNTGLADLSLPLITKIGSIKLEILDVQTEK